MRLNPKATYVVLFTRGRIDRQKTLRYLTPEIIANTIVVTCASEHTALADQLKADGIKPLLIKSFPDDHKLIKKRYLMAKWLQANGCKQFLFADDDLTFQVLIDGRYKTARTEAGQAALNDVWKKLPAIWSEYAGIGFAGSSRNNYDLMTDERKHPTGLFVHENTKNACIFGYKTDMFVRQFAFMEKHGLLQDVAYIDLMSNLLTLQEANYVRIYDVAFAANFDTNKASGGMNVYRNEFTNNRAIALLVTLFPGATTKGKDQDKRFELGRINRHAWKPVNTWSLEKFQWGEWYANATHMLKGLGTPNKAFSTLAAVKYLQAIMGKFATMAGMRPDVTRLEIYNEEIILHHEGKTLRGTPKPILAKVKQLTNQGKAVRVELKAVKPKPHAKDLAAQINRAVLANWRIV